MIYRLKNMKKKLKIKCELNIEDIKKKDVKKLMLIQKLIRELKNNKFDFEEKFRQQLITAKMEDILKEIDEIQKHLKS